MPDTEGLSKDLEQAVESIARFVRDTLASLPRREPPDPWPILLPLIREMARPANQSEILQALLQGALDHADRAAMFIVRRGFATGWVAHGFQGEPVQEEIREIQIDLQQDTVFREVVRSRQTLAEDDQEGSELSFLRFGQTEPREALYLPLTTRSRVVGVLYADVVQEGRRLGRAGLEVLALVASLALERLLLQSRLGSAGAQGRAPEATVSPRSSPPPPAGPVDTAGQPTSPWTPHTPTSPSGPEVPSATSPEPGEPVVFPPEGSPAEQGDALSFARLLVTEIKLYNEHEVAQGRKGRDLYRRLRDTIERSRRMYEERIAGHQMDRDYFEEQILEVLAGGDPEALGPRDAG